VSVIEKAQELGYALRDTEEATILQAAEINLERDLESRNLIREFQQRFEMIKKAQDAGEEVSDEEWESFNQLQQKVKENKNIQAYFAAQKRFQSLLQQVNTIINKILRGESCSSGCSGDCSGCM
jgi:cell fate (sporulation/competence/biofilm development) regulator YlbF (YheA/YmcA/DUF963 family)